jgi:ion channel-forming bestrophin family protein
MELEGFLSCEDKRSVVPIDFYAGQRQVHTWGARIWAFVRSTVFKRLLASGVVLSIYLAFGQLVVNKLHWSFNLKIDDITGLGAVLSILLVLRTNSAYERWWEARKLWGQLVNECRNLALKVTTMVDADEPDRVLGREYIASFPFCLRDHLRKGPEDATIAGLPEPLPGNVTHVPAYVSGKLFTLVKKWRDQGKLQKLDHHLIDQHIKALLDVCGACERILNTPLPLSHRALIPQLLGVYLIVVPLSLELDLKGILVGMGVAYFLLGLELIAEEIEEPFGNDTDDLPLDTIAGNIRRVVYEIFATDYVTPAAGESHS